MQVFEHLGFHEPNWRATIIVDSKGRKYKTYTLTICSESNLGRSVAYVQSAYACIGVFGYSREDKPRFTNNISLGHIDRAEGQAPPCLKYAATTPRNFIRDAHSAVELGISLASSASLPPHRDSQGSSASPF